MTNNPQIRKLASLASARHAVYIREHSSTSDSPENDIRGAEALILAAALWGIPAPEISHPRPVLSRLNAKLTRFYGVSIKATKKGENWYSFEPKSQLQNNVAFLRNKVYLKPIPEIPVT